MNEPSVHQTDRPCGPGCACSSGCGRGLRWGWIILAATLILGILAVRLLRTQPAPPSTESHAPPPGK